MPNNQGGTPVTAHMPQIARWVGHPAHFRGAAYMAIQSPERVADL